MVRDLDPTVEAAPVVRCGVDVSGGEVLLTCAYGSGNFAECGESEMLEVEEDVDMALTFSSLLG